MARGHSHSCRSRARISMLAAVIGAAFGVIGACSVLQSSACAFTGSTTQRRLRQRMRAEETSSSTSATSVALVKITEENTMTTASVLGGFAGLWLGGFWLGVGAFAAAAYFARSKDDEVSSALKGTSKAGLEALNFVAAVNDKYEITDKLGSAFYDAAQKVDSQGSVKSALDNLGDTIRSVDEEIRFKDTLGSAATSASEIASQAVTKVTEYNDQLKITDKIKEKIDEVTKSSK